VALPSGSGIGPVVSAAARGVPARRDELRPCGPHRAPVSRGGGQGARYRRSGHCCLLGIPPGKPGMAARP